VIVDTSAIIAIAMKEPGFETVLDKLMRASNVGIGIPTLAETAIVLSARLRRDARGLVTRFLLEAAIVTVPFGEAHYNAATTAWLRFGRGRHPASLDIGDCMSYATASVAALPLLCTGEDFVKTDLAIA
jgi:ribonuclease VapC